MHYTAQATGVAYRYPQNNRGLSPLSLEIKAGDAVLVTGPSGCGKSTLARCLTGLIPHLYRGELSGEVRIDGMPTAQTPLWQLAEQAGMVFQNPAAQMLTTSVEEEIIFGLENLGLPPHDIRDRLESALARFGLEALRHRAPQTLSGGEQQKLALAAITARRPSLLVLDEPLSMLDGRAVADLTAHLTDLTDHGTGIVICEHRAGHLQAIPGLHSIQLNGYAVQEPTEPDHASRFTHHTLDFTLKVSKLGVTLGRHPVLHDLSFSAAGGSVVAIAGRNGVGKTTLLRALAGLQKHSGTIAAGGMPPDLGLVFQNPDLQLFNPNVREEILYRVPEPDRELYAWLIEALGLAPYEETPPLLLSEGEKKRVALALVLMHRPQHGILLDEPSLGQDAAHKATLIHLCRALAAAGKLVILTTHDLALAAEADRLLLLGDEGFVADGPPIDVLRDADAWSRVGLPAPAVEVLREPEVLGKPGGVPVIRLGTSGRTRKLALVERSPLRQADPRTKLALSLCASLAVMLPLERLAVFMLAYVLLLLWARLLPEAARQVWRLKWVLAGLFLLDWLLVGLDLAAIVTLRLTLLAGAFALFFATTTPRELQSALEWLRVPYRYAFSVSLAFQSIGLLEDEWRAIREAQHSRGAWSPITGWRSIRRKVSDLVSLTVPVVVLTAKRAWAMTEAAYARGFESPHRRPYYRLAMRRLDWILLAGALAASAALIFWR